MKKSALINTRSLIVLALMIIPLLLTGCGNKQAETTDTAEQAARFLIITDKKYGFIDEKGAISIKPQFDDVSEKFSEGLCLVKVGEKYGYIDTAGKYVIPPQFENAQDFSENLALVKSNGKYGYVDKSGKYIINPQFEDASSFSEGLAIIILDNKYGYIDKTGKMVINAQFDYAEPFAEGLAKITIGDRTGFIDTKGNYVVNPQYYDADKFSGGLAAVQPSIDSDIGYIDKTGQMIINPQFAHVSFFSEDMACVQIMDKWGFIDNTGKIIINPQFDDALPFSQSLARVRVGEKWGYINKSGDYLVNPQFDDAYDFANGLAPVLVYNTAKQTVLMSYIDTTGKSVWSLELKESDFKNKFDEEPTEATFSEDDLSTIPLSEVFWKMSASSILPPSYSLSYEPELIRDYDSSTAWVEGKPDDGIGEWVDLTSDSKTIIYAIDIINGYQASEDLYYANNRIKKIQISFSDGTSITEDLADHSFGWPDTIFLPEGKVTSSVRFTILEVYPGDSYQDTCISEVEFF